MQGTGSLEKDNFTTACSEGGKRDESGLLLIYGKSCSLQLLAVFRPQLVIHLLVASYGVSRVAAVLCFLTFSVYGLRNFIKSDWHDVSIRLLFGNQTLNGEIMMQAFLYSKALKLYISFIQF